MQEKEQLSPEELQSPNLSTLPVEDITEEKTIEDVVEIPDEDLDKRNYIKISKTFYIQPVKNEDENDETELYKVLNPIEGTVETRELTKDEEKEIKILQLKQQKLRFQPISHPRKTISITKDADVMGRISHITKTRVIETNKTVNKYGTAYKKKRKRKNKLTKASRKANR